MQVVQNRKISLIVVIIGVLVMMTIQPASAVSRCGNFEMVPMPGRVLQIVPFEDGTASAIGYSSTGPTIQVLRHFDGETWSEQSLPSDLDGFAFGAAGGTPYGEAWFAGTRAFSVYEIEVVFMRVINGVIDRTDTTRSSFGAPIDISASASNNVWALTSAGDVFHFDGSSWDSTDVPAVFTDQQLNPKGIYSISSDDVWITGYGSVGKMADHGYVQHWDGSSWSVVSTPYDEQIYTHFFRDIDGSGPNDIWIAGYDPANSEGILLHWNGNSWTKEPEQPINVFMARVMAMEPGNAWALPIQDSGIFYWDSSAWTHTSDFVFPDEAVTISVRDVEKAGNCDAWVVGDYHDGTSYQPWAARLIPGDVPPGETFSEIFVDTTDITRVRASRKSYYAEATVTILDGDMNPVGGAVVSGNFSGPTNEILSITTNTNGMVVFRSITVSKPDIDWCFSVTNIVKSDATYNESLNTEASACEGGGDSGGGKGKKGRR